MSRTCPAITPDISQRIGRLRALAILLVPLTHANKIQAVLSPPMSWGEIFVTADIFYNIGHLCIPFFFAVSGYLFFTRQPVGFDGYALTLKKKFRSLILPMVVLNGALYLYLRFVGSIPYIGGSTVALEKGVVLGVLGLWGSPLNYSLWFLRDLFTLFALYPVLAVVLSEIPWTGFFIVCGIWNLVSGPVDFVSLVFFYFGGLLAVTGADLHAGRRLTPLLALVYAGCLVVQGLKAASTGILYGDILTYRVGLLSGTMLLWQLGASPFILKNRLLTHLAPYSFMVYLFHEPILSFVIFGLVKLPLIRETHALFLPQAACWVLTVVLAWLAAVLLRRACPPLYSLLSGGRA